jgi:hypothetical protein
MNSLSLTYQGFFNDSITGQLTALMESALVENQLDYRTRTKLKALLVEQVQNIQRYSSQTRQGLVEVGREDGAIYIKTCNPIDPDSRDELDSRLSDLADVDGPTLRRRFRDAIHQPLTNDRGAGLGFLFLAKKSSRRLDYRFIPGEGQDLCFQLKSYIEKEPHHG